MKLRGRRIAFGTLAAFSLAALTATGDAIYLWTLFFQALLLLLGFVQVRLTLRAADLEVGLPRGRAESGGSVEISLKAAIVMPIPPAHVSVRLATPDARREREEIFVSLPPGIERECVVKCECPYRGEYDIGAVRVEATDVLGLVRMSIEGDGLRTEKVRLAVCPKPYDLARELLDLRMSGGEEDGGSSRTGEVSSIAGLRDWREGDPLVRVHWKVSARLGKPIVKEFDGSLDARNLIFADCTRAGFSEPDGSADELENRISRLDAEETIASAAASFCRLFCENGRDVRLVTCSEERRESVSRGRDGGYDALLLHLAEMSFGGSVDAAKMLSLECERYGVPDSLVFITGDVTGDVSEALSALASGGSRITLVSCGRADGKELDRLRAKGVSVRYAPGAQGYASFREEPEDAGEPEEANGYAD